VNPPVVMDTNVPIVANGAAGQAGPNCVLACVDALVRIRQRHCVLLDQGGLILDEYRRYLSPAGEPGAGDAFFKWLWDSQCSDLCQTVAITPHETRGFAEFPDDADLQGFDPSDRKFVAVAVAGGSAARVVNASDTDWWAHRKALARYGVIVQFLCPELMTEQPPSTER
jgi:hypothetical protein